MGTMWRSYFLAVRGGDAALSKLLMDFLLTKVNGKYNANENCVLLPRALSKLRNIVWIICES